MKEYKAEQEQKRQTMHKHIAQQRTEIAKKEQEIKTKNAQLKQTEDEYEGKLKDLAAVYEAESRKKLDLEQ